MVWLGREHTESEVTYAPKEVSVVWVPEGPRMKDQETYVSSICFSAILTTSADAETPLKQFDMALAELFLPIIIPHRAYASTLL